MTMVDVDRTIEGARDALTVKRVFGEPYVENGITVIPAATVQGGAGGGAGEGPEGTGRGGGSGFGVIARPAGVYVVKDGDVAWRPAIDVNRIVLGAQVVAVLALLLARTVAKSRARVAVARRQED
jgi:uncharacterized spore protein YtfJ